MLPILKFAIKTINKKILAGVYKIPGQFRSERNRTQQNRKMNKFNKKKDFFFPKSLLFNNLVLAISTPFYIHCIVLSK
jgi:hypothetical protein